MFVDWKDRKATSRDKKEFYNKKAILEIKPELNVHYTRVMKLLWHVHKQPHQKKKQ